ncbi:hypothetical protein D4A92_12475 [Rhizobium rosettiformans]|uniref:Uncharacterized protein n=1 Tax=Rhizobium rosettiformans TaxID=1368430 RepID=A0ABX7EWE8_9HYPH|nr:hypothetical protein D4A92_12475 [Rhizobium rosettiformans]
MARVVGASAFSPHAGRRFRQADEGLSAQTLPLRCLRQQASKGETMEEPLVLRGEHSLPPQDEGWSMIDAANTLPLRGRVGPKVRGGVTRRFQKTKPIRQRSKQVEA